MNTVINYKGNSPIIKSVLEFAFETKDLPFSFILIVDALNPKDLIEFIVDNKIYNISSWVHLPDGYYCFLIRHIDKSQIKELNIIVIQRAWRKYFLKKVKVRNDLIVHGLAEYFGHPSRLSFEIN